MKKIFYLLLSVTSLLWSIDLDIGLLKKSYRENPQDVGNIVLIVRYYLQNRDYETAQSYLRHILNRAQENKIVLKLQKETKLGLELHKYLPKTNLQNPYKIENKLSENFNSKKYDSVVHIYRLLDTLKIPVTPLTDCLAAEAYIKTGDMTQAQKVLKTKKPPHIPERLAVQTFLEARKGDLAIASKNLAKLQKMQPQNPLISDIDKMLRIREKERIQAVAGRVSKSNSFEALQEYVYLLNKQNKRDKAIRTAATFLKKNPDNIQAKILLIKLYYWNGDLDKAFHKIYRIRKITPQTRKLYAYILYEKGDYTHALVYLPEAVRYAETPQERYNLKKRLAFAYAHTGKQEKANRLFGQLLRQHPNDHEITQFRAEQQKQYLLKYAINAYKQKRYAEALKYYRAYFNRTKDPKIAKEIAEIYFFIQKNYTESLPWYRRYLENFPNDQLIRFHYASALEKEKEYKQAADAFGTITECSDAHLCHLTRYHQSYSLMQTQEDNDWLQARAILKKLTTDLALSQDTQDHALQKFVATLYKTARGEIKKPTYYKDIVLTEGSKKELDPKNVFANIDIVNTTKPSLETLLDISKEKSKPKPTLQFQMDYVHDSEVRYRNYQLKIADLLTVNGIRYSASTQKYLFTFKDKSNVKGKGFALHMQKGSLELGLGVKEIGEFNTLIPKLIWAPVYGSHNLYFDLFYQNGAFINYRNCMIKNRTNVLHIGFNDRMLMDNFDFTEMGLSVNAYEDGNINAYATFLYPFYHFSLLGLEHRVLLNENIDYNSKTDVCYSPAALYDSSYLIYNPKITFGKGSLEVQFGQGYSFKNRENISSYVIKGDYRVSGLGSMELNCERVQSSFTSDDIDYCTFNIIQEW